MPRRARAGPLDGTVRAGTRLFGVFAGFQLSSADSRDSDASGTFPI